MEKAKPIVSIKENGEYVINSAATFFEVTDAYEQLRLLFENLGDRKIKNKDYPEFDE